MRTATLAAFLALLALPATALALSCADPRAVPATVVSVSPEGPGAPVDSAIVVEFTWSSWTEQDEVRLERDDGSLVDVDVVASLPNLRVLQPVAPLAPDTTYFVEFVGPSRSPAAELATFQTSSTALDAVPAAPTLVSSRARSEDYFATNYCGPFEDWIEVEIEEQADLALLAVSGDDPPTSVADALATTHETTLRTEWQIWEPGAQLTLYLATLAPNGAFSGWEEARTIVMPPAGTTSCATAPGAPAWGWLLLLPLLRRRRPAARGGRRLPRGRGLLVALLLVLLSPATAAADPAPEPAGPTESTSATPPPTTSRPSTASWRLADASRSFGIAASVAGATCIAPAVATALRKPASGELLAGCVGFAVPLTASALVTGGLSRALRDRRAPSRSLHRRFAGTSALFFGLGVGMAIATVPAALISDFLLPGSFMSTITATASASGFHLGVLHAVLAERYDPGRRALASKRPRVHIVPTPFGVAGVF